MGLVIAANILSMRWPLLLLCWVVGWSASQTQFRYFRIVTQACSVRVIGELWRATAFLWLENAGAARPSRQSAGYFRVAGDPCTNPIGPAKSAAREVTANGIKVSR